VNTLYEAALFMGSVRSFGETTLDADSTSVKGMSMRELFPDMPADATHVGGYRLMSDMTVLHTPVTFLRQIYP